MDPAKKNLLARYNSFENAIRFSQKINGSTMPDFAAALNLALKRRPYVPLKIDFTPVAYAYSDGMLGIISRITDLRSNGHNFHIILPNDAKVRKLFRQRNWAHYLDPKQHPKSESQHDRHLVTKQFEGYQEVATIVKDFAKVVLGSMRTKRDVISGLEWSVNEICDNVINHSESKIGGFAEVTSFPTNECITFVVADSGRGILSSLKEGIPSLRTDIQAIGEAIKSGVTRNKEFGQGNGLAGSLRITTLTGGLFDIRSGMGRISFTKDDNKHSECAPEQIYRGTIVSGTIRTNTNFSIDKALGFDNIGSYTPVDIIEMEYERPDQRCMVLTLNAETTGVGTRKAGKQMRIKTLNLLQSQPGFPVIVDWEGVPVISSSFADEYMGKLFLELGATSFSAAIKNKNMEILIQRLIDKAIAQRLTQANDSE